MLLERVCRAQPSGCVCLGVARCRMNKFCRLGPCNISRVAGSLLFLLFFPVECVFHCQLSDRIAIQSEGACAPRAGGDVLGLTGTGHGPRVLVPTLIRLCPIENVPLALADGRVKRCGRVHYSGRDVIGGCSPSEARSSLAESYDSLRYRAAFL